MTGRNGILTLLIDLLSDSLIDSLIYLLGFSGAQATWVIMIQKKTVIKCVLEEKTRSEYDHVVELYESEVK